MPCIEVKTKIQMKTILLIAVMAISLHLIAQLSGEISYTTKVNMHKKLPPGERRERMKEWMPEFSEFKNQLLFSTDETLYRNVVEEEDDNLLQEEELSKAERRMKWVQRRMAPANDIVYCDVKNGLVVEKKEFMDKTFLIRDTLELAKWKITGEQKEVSGMNCMKAVYIPDEGDTTKIEVWFTPEIPVSSGPAGYGGLPGLILHLDVDEGAIQISVSNIVMRELEKGEIKEPKKGKEVTQEEFEEIRRKKMEEQRQMHGGRGGPGRGGPPAHR